MIACRLEPRPEMSTPSRREPLGSDPVLYRGQTPHWDSALLLPHQVPPMARQRRVTIGNHVYHVMNRAAKRTVLFANASDYLQFERTLEAALARFPMRILAYCLMPNHWHLLLWPR